jgi:SNF2 family DNA or RNA helicase
MSYTYTYTPFAHQLEGIQLYRGRPYYGFFDQPGCGKSKIVVDGSNLLFLDKALFGAVIVCPNTVKSTWANPEWGQIAKHTPAAVPHQVYRIEAGKRLPKVDLLLREKERSFVWLIVNYEALRNPKVEDYLRDFLRDMAPAAMVLDESTKVKNRTALQTKAALRLSQYASRRYILTGTPIAKNPLDLYTQINFLSPSILRFPHFVAFRNRYAQMGGYHVGGRPVQVVGWQNLEELKGRIQGHTRVIDKRKALPDLPPKLYTRMEVLLSEEQDAAYTMMKEHAVTTVPGEIGQATASIALTKILRLSQITSGHVPLVNSITGATQLVSFKHNPKFDTILELLEDVPFMVVFAMFIVEIQDLAARLTEHGITSGLIYGETSLAERESIQERFQRGDVRVVICQVVTGGIGIQLTHGDTAVFMTNPYSYEARTQAEDRLHRPGQVNESVHYVDLIATTRAGGRTVDHTVLRALERKQNLSDAVLGQTMLEVL